MNKQIKQSIQKQKTKKSSVPKIPILARITLFNENRADISNSFIPYTIWINNLTLKSIISKLPQEEQELIFLRYVNEIGVTAICKITGFSRFAVYRRLSKVLKWLKELFKGYL